MNHEKFYLPKHLDAAPRFLLWSMDSALSVLVPLFVGMVMGLGLLTPLLGILSGYCWKKVKGSGGTNLIKAIIYWYYPRSVLGLKKAPDSSIRTYIS